MLYLFAVLPVAVGWGLVYGDRRVGRERCSRSTSSSSRRCTRSRSPTRATGSRCSSSSSPRSSSEPSLRRGVAPRRIAPRCSSTDRRRALDRRGGDGARSRRRPSGFARGDDALDELEGASRRPRARLITAPRCSRARVEPRRCASRRVDGDLDSAARRSPRRAPATSRSTTPIAPSCSRRSSPPRRGSTSWSGTCSTSRASRPVPPSPSRSSSRSRSWSSTALDELGAERRPGRREPRPTSSPLVRVDAHQIQRVLVEPARERAQVLAARRAGAAAGRRRRRRRRSCA